MNKQFCLNLLTVLAFAGTVHAWQETRTPLSLFEGYMHYPLDRDRELNDFKLDTHFWTGIYFRTAPNAYNSCGDNITSNSPCACPGSKASLASLYFGKSTFTFEQAFANSFIPQGTVINPLVLLEPVTINIDYREQGVWFGTNFSTRFGCDDRWNAGLRIRIPFRDIKVEPLCGNPITNADSTNPAAALYQQRVESITVDSVSITQNVFAARLDALTVLNRVAIDTTGAAVPLVNYTPTGGDITVAAQGLSGGIEAAAPVTALQPPLAFIESANGSAPVSVRWADIPANGATVVKSDGSGLSNLQRGRTASNVSYAALGADQAAQAQLWLVPNVQNGGTTAGVLAPTANTVYATLTNAFNALANSSLADFTNQVGLNVCYGNTRGMGDLNMELFLGYDWIDYGFAEGRLWVTAPTGIKVQDPLQALKFPTGNNGHPEVGLGMAAGVEKLRYLTFNFDAYYIWVLSTCNNIAAPFAGATVKNIGPCIPAKTAWKYGIVDLNVNVINPCYECMGVMFGYQAYIKGKDHIQVYNTTATDFAGRQEPLNTCLLTQNSDRVAHRIRTETFFNGECMNTFLGFVATVAGKNIPAEVDFHIGLDVYF